MLMANVNDAFQEGMAAAVRGVFRNSEEPSNEEKVQDALVQKVVNTTDAMSQRNLKREIKIIKTLGGEVETAKAANQDSTVKSLGYLQKVVDEKAQAQARRYKKQHKSRF
jgi:hypothetical protein